MNAVVQVVSPGPNSPPCVICGSADWRLEYRGPIRTGGFGEYSSREGEVLTCGDCGVQWLDEASRADQTIYQSETYLKQVGQEPGAENQQQIHDRDQLRNLGMLWPGSVRDAVVADVGSSAGSFLDHIGGLAQKVYAIEPSRYFHGHLRSSGYHVFSSVRECADEVEGQVDHVFCFSVIEHVSDPVELLSDMWRMLRPGGRLLLSTPNHCDALLELVGDEYRQFFYRSVHSFYFHPESLALAGKTAGWQVDRIRCLQRFGLANAMIWLRDRCPSGNSVLDAVESPVLDGCYRNKLETSMRADYLYLSASRPE